MVPLAERRKRITRQSFWRVEFRNKPPYGPGAVVVQAGNRNGALREATTLLHRELDLIRIVKLK